MFFPLRDDNPTRRPAVLTVLLILLNVAVFFYQNVLSPRPPEYYVYSTALVPWEITHWRHAELPVPDSKGNVVGYFPRDISPLASLLFSLFMHGSVLHILGNMLFLWIFGNNIEDYLGRVRFIFFYFLAGFSSSLIHVLFHPASLTPVIGASGAVSGVMGAYLVLYPRARIRTLVFLFFLITTVDIPAAVFLLIWFAFQFTYAGAGEGIAWLAHVGGFLMGIVLLLLLTAKRKPRVQFLNS